MDVRTLEYFVLVAEEGSISAGARRAMVAQPAVSVALKKLERDVGAPLLERSYGGVELTAAGHAARPGSAGAALPRGGSGRDPA